MAIRKKTKYLVRFFTNSGRRDIEYCGRNLQECVGKLSDFNKKNVTSFTIYINGEKQLNMPIELYGKL